MCLRVRVGAGVLPVCVGSEVSLHPTLTMVGWSGKRKMAALVMVSFVMPTIDGKSIACEVWADEMVSRMDLVRCCFQRNLKRMWPPWPPVDGRIPVLLWLSHSTLPPELTWKHVLSLFRCLSFVLLSFSVCLYDSICASFFISWCLYAYVCALVLYACLSVCLLYVCLSCSISYYSLCEFYKCLVVCTCDFLCLLLAVYMCDFLYVVLYVCVCLSSVCCFPRCVRSGLCVRMSVCHLVCMHVSLPACLFLCMCVFLSIIYLLLWCALISIRLDLMQFNYLETNLKLNSRDQIVGNETSGYWGEPKRGHNSRAPVQKIEIKATAYRY